jgi:predicted Zn-dependent peptidase
MIGAEVNKSNLELAITEIRAELRDLRETEVEEGELMLARNHLIGSLQSDMANLFSVIEKIKNIHLNNLPLTYYQDLFHRLDQVSPKDLLRVANQHLSADSLFEVAVG